MSIEDLELCTHNSYGAIDISTKDEWHQTGANIQGEIKLRIRKVSEEGKLYMQILGSERTYFTKRIGKHSHEEHRTERVICDVNSLVNREAFGVNEYSIAFNLRLNETLPPSFSYKGSDGSFAYISYILIARYYVINNNHSVDFSNAIQLLIKNKPSQITQYTLSQAKMLEGMCSNQGKGKINCHFIRDYSYYPGNGD